MDTGDLRKLILRSLDDARKDSAERRRVHDAAHADYERFLTSVATPLMRQAADVLRAEGQQFIVNTPAGSIRLASEASPLTFLEFELDASGAQAQVIGRISVPRGRQGHFVEERSLAPGVAIGEIGDDTVAQFLVAEIPKLVMRM